MERSVDFKYTEYISITKNAVATPTSPKHL